MSGTATARRPGTKKSAPVAERYRRRRRRWPLVLVGVLVLGLVGTGVWLVGFSEVLATRRVEVRGTDTVAEADVTRAAQVELGLPLARQDIEAIAGRVAALTAVETVEVTREYPDKVLIVIHERTPVLAVRDGDGHLVLDRHGVVFRRVKKAPSGTLEAEFNAGNTALARQLAEVAGALPADLRKRIAVISATSESRIELELKNGDRVIWGTAEESALKATVLLKLLDRRAKVYNVSSPRHPALR